MLVVIKNLEYKGEFIMKNNNKGFTLSELLIVVAIIAVLVAVSIPIFTTQLEKSRDSVSVSNIRAAYAEASTAFLTANGKAVATNGNVTVAAPDSGKQTVTVTGVVIKSQAADGWSDQASELPFAIEKVVDPGEPGNYTMTFTFSLKGSGTKPEVELGAKE